MNDMVEKVARAIKAAELKWKAENGGDNASCSDCPDTIKGRAAIEAMHEPTAEMKQATREVRFIAVPCANGDAILPAGAHDVWRAMIDAALKEG